jgi:ribosomal subunit interface protein
MAVAGLTAAQEAHPVPGGPLPVSSPPLGGAYSKEADVDIVVRGRHLEVSDRFREHVSEKLEKVARFDPAVNSIDVEVSKESNPRLADRAFRVELTCRSRGPVIRAEAAADEKYAALDAALDKLENRLRRHSDRRGDHRRRDAHRVAEVAEEGRLASTPPVRPDTDFVVDDGAATRISSDGPMVVREKVHAAAPMTLDEALYRMELVGHDFFLFADRESGRPSVVYRRRGYDYGVIHLDLAD